MGSRTTDMQAISYMDQLERQALSIYPSCIFFTRYIDDILMLTSSSKETTTIYEKFQNIDRHIQFKIVLYVDLQPRQICHSIGVGELGWQYETGLKSHSTVTNWCTGREWPVNCMTVISARWQSNMLFQRQRKCIFWRPVMGRYWVGDWTII